MKLFWSKNSSFATFKRSCVDVFAILSNVSCHNGAAPWYNMDFAIAKALFSWFWAEMAN